MRTDTSASAMKFGTEKQLRRRQEILSAARHLLSEAGYAGLTMRALAKTCGVSTKLLYDVYGSKEALISQAVAERIGLVYDAIENANREKGVGHLMTLASGIADAMLELPNFAHAFANGMALHREIYTRENLSSRIIRRCLQEIGQAGGLPRTHDFDLLEMLIRMQFQSVIMHWNAGDVPDAQLHAFMQLGACHVIKTLVTGEPERHLLDVEARLLETIGAAFPF
jgi:AcrR family transcriptional regulator